MIVKSIAHKGPSYRSLLQYMFRGADEDSIVVTHNVTSQDIDGWVKEYRECEKYRENTRRSDATFLDHQVLSFHTNDVSKVHPSTLRDITEKFIDMRGPNTLAVATSHQETGTTHVHVAFSQIDLLGKNITMSIPEYRKLKQDLQLYQLEKYPELTQSVADHGRTKRDIIREKHLAKQNLPYQTPRRDELAVAAKTAISLADNFESFEQALEKHGLSIYLRGGKVTGIRSNTNKKYRLSTLGITEQDLEQLNEREQRNQELSDMRSDRGQSQERDFGGR